MMKTLLLICVLATPRADCSADTAEAVILGPDAASLIECGLHGQVYIAHGAIAGYLDGAHYLKITCSSGQHPQAPRIQPVQNAEQPGRTVQATD